MTLGQHSLEPFRDGIRSILTHTPQPQTPITSLLGSRVTVRMMQGCSTAHTCRCRCSERKTRAVFNPKLDSRHGTVSWLILSATWMEPLTVVLFSTQINIIGK